MSRYRAAAAQIKGEKGHKAMNGDVKKDVELVKSRTEKIRSAGVKK